MAMRVVGQNSKPVQVAVITRAGMVKMMPAARDSPALATVCTRLLSSRLLRRSTPRNTAMAMTAAGIDALMVMPA